MMARTIAMIVLLLLLAAPRAMAHPRHAQVTEVEWNARTQRFEVAMKLDAAAVEDSVTASRGRRFRLESAESVDDVLSAWLPGSFRVITDQSTTGKIRWVGHELQLHSIWLYFEFEPVRTSARSLEPQSDTIRIENRCVMDVRQETVHFVRLREGSQLHSGHCTNRQPVTSLSSQHRNARFSQSF